MIELAAHPDLLSPGWPAARLNTGTAHPARMYDYYLGGRDNYQVDRDAAEQVLTDFPQIRPAALANRRFLQRAVSMLAGAGISQFIDVGCGIPGNADATATARAINPHVRIAAVDNEPLVLTHASALLPADHPESTAVIEADLRQPETILRHPALLDLLDLREPVGLLLVGVLHFLTDQDQPQRVVRTLMKPLAPGSYLVLSHATADQEQQAALAAADRYLNTLAPITLRSRTQIAALLDGLDVLEPGVIALPWWRPDGEPTENPRANWGYGAAARKP